MYTQSFHTIDLSSLDTVTGGKTVKEYLGPVLNNRYAEATGRVLNTMANDGWDAGLAATAIGAVAGGAVGLATGGPGGFLRGSERGWAIGATMGAGFGLAHGIGNEAGVWK